MARRFSKVAVLGLGKVGSLVALLLKDAGFEVTGFDRGDPAEKTVEVVELDVTDGSAVERALSEVEAVVSCVPFGFTTVVAEAAAAAGTHYFDLTEDVTASASSRQLASGRSVVVAPQCGLAPGLIAIVGAALTKDFDDLRAIELRVGALPRHPSGLLGYAFNWSPEGVVNEYLNDCDVLRDGRRKLVPAMEELETVVVAGTTLEAFTTSGGLGTMCTTFEGKVDRLDYKTLRYPGHCRLMRFFFDELYLRERRELAGEILVNAKPPVDDDIVYLYAAVEGHRQGRLRREQAVRTFEPRTIGGLQWRAISWTTAASACAVVELAAAGTLEGLVRQEDIDYDVFLATRSGTLLH